MITIFFLLFISVFAEIKTCKCNDNIKCQLDTTTKTLTVSGNGQWKSIEECSKTEVSILSIEKGIISVEHTFFQKSGFLTSVKCANECSLKTIGDNAFSDATSINSFSSKTIETIGVNSFMKTKFLEFDFSSIKTIGKEAFKGSQLKEVSFPQTLETIGTNAFEDCPIVKYNVNANNKIYSSDEDGALYEKRNGIKALISYPPQAKAKTLFKVANGTQIIRQNALKDISSFKTIDLNDVVSVEPNGINNCNGVTEMRLGKKTSHLTKESFSGFPLIEKYTVPQENTFFSSEDGILFTKDVKNKALIRYPLKKAISEKYSIPSGVKVIYDYAFADITSLKELTIGNDVYSIHSYAFKECINLEKVTITASIKSVGTSVFEGMEKLSTVVLGDNVQMIGKRMFASCTKLTSLTVGKGIVSIESHAFVYSPIQSIVIPETCKYIMTNAFSGCSELTSVKIGSNVKEISRNTFSNCKKLATVDLSTATSLLRIDDNAFAMTSALKYIEIPASVQVVSELAFYQSAIEKVYYHGLQKPNYCSMNAFKETGLKVVNVPKNYVHLKFCFLDIKRDES